MIWGVRLDFQERNNQVIWAQLRVKAEIFVTHM
jgi:hypothetical protein